MMTVVLRGEAGAESFVWDLLHYCRSGLLELSCAESPPENAVGSLRSLCQCGALLPEKVKGLHVALQTRSGRRCVAKPQPGQR